MALELAHGDLHRAEERYFHADRGGFVADGNELECLFQIGDGTVEALAGLLFGILALAFEAVDVLECLAEELEAVVKLRTPALVIVSVESAPSSTSRAAPVMSVSAPHT